MILFFYVLREYIKFAISTVLLGIFLFLLFDFIHNSTGYFGKYNPSAEVLFKYYLYRIPGQFLQSLPLASLLASVVVMVILSRNNEITAMRAAMMGPLAIGAPLAAGGALLAIVAYVANEWVVPRTAGAKHYVTKVLLEGDDDYDLAGGVRWIRHENQIFHFKDYDSGQRILHHIKLLELGPGFRTLAATHAERATLTAQGDEWTLSEVKKLTFNQEGMLKAVKRFDEIQTKLPIQPKKLVVDYRTPDELSLVELSSSIERGKNTGIDMMPLEIAWHVKLAYPLAAFVVSLLGLRFGYRSERTTETVRSILVAVAIGSSYWFIFNAARALAKSDHLPPVVAAWLANVVIFSIVVFQMFKVRRT